MAGTTERVRKGRDVCGTSESAPYSIAVVEDVDAATRLPSAFASAAGVAPWQRQDQEHEIVARV